ncbi:MAG TPA: tRNA (adenosine(37)-N6)-threonylcarbamoyltransferase complex dimerization subunit type 1 TsaB [Geothermobacteraceae bacterium]|nr:tRNA (adenosine(37)-N6)-threonylcarbamoyltransferase complex dimerization subunit type 1 TsaB [Geothermobacteraceae bacterium]
MALLLTLDTTTRSGGIALSRGPELLAEYSCLVPGHHTDWLLQAIKRTLADTGLTLQQLDGIGVVRGPGAFTGLRVGMATAKGLAIGLGLPMVGVSSLQALAVGLCTELPVCALLDARKQEVYAGVYQVDEFPPRPLGPERVVGPEQLLATLTGEILFVGDGAVAYREQIEHCYGRQGRFAAGPADRLRPGAAAALAHAAWESGEACSPAVLNPSYIRPSEAEIAWSLKSQNAAIQG